MPPPGPAESPAVTFLLGLRMRGRRALVVGGGGAAARLVDRMRAAGADVLVVAPVLNAELADLAAHGLVTVRRRDFVPADLDRAWLVVACADQPSVNASVAEAAERSRIWCVAPGDEAVSSALQPEGTAAPTAAAAASDADSRAGRRVLVLGGARSGKSATAESMLADGGAVDYIATGHRAGSGDLEWDRRVRAHQERRPAHWRTFETLDLERVLAEPQPTSAVLIDCISTWLAQVMDDCGIWIGRAEADSELSLRTDAVVAAWQQTRRCAVAVSNEVGCGVVPATRSGRRFRDELGWLNARLAAACDEVWLCTAGIAQRLR